MLGNISISFPAMLIRYHHVDQQDRKKGTKIFQALNVLISNSKDEYHPDEWTVLCRNTSYDYIFGIDNFGRRWFSFGAQNTI